MRNRTTIVDVAKAAGVSKSLVSLAIRGDAGVSDETRQRILAVADDLGYRSNVWARSLAHGKTNMIGVLLTDLSNPYHTDVVIGVEDAAHERGQNVLISHGRRDPDLLASQLRKFEALGVDGIIVISAHTPSDVIADIAQRTRVVIVGRPGELPESVSRIRNDDELGARRATTHLLESGRTRIAFLQNSTSPSARARQKSYEQTLREAGLDPLILTPGDLTADAFTGIDGIVAANDRGAVHALGEASDAGVRVPSDLAIVGYDNSQLSRVVRPQLSSVDQPRIQMGGRALEAVLGNEVIHEVFEPELVIRDSSVLERATVES